MHHDVKKSLQVDFKSTKNIPSQAVSSCPAPIFKIAQTPKLTIFVIRLNSLAYDWGQAFGGYSIYFAKTFIDESIAEEDIIRWDHFGLVGHQNKILVIEIGR